MHSEKDTYVLGFVDCVLLIRAEMVVKDPVWMFWLDQYNEYRLTVNRYPEAGRKWCDKGGAGVW